MGRKEGQDGALTDAELAKNEDLGGLTHAQTRTVQRVLLMLPLPDRPRRSVLEQLCRVAIWFGIVMMITGASALLIPVGTPGALPLSVLSVGILCVVVFGMLGRWYLRRAMRLMLEPYNGCVCPRCLHPLSTLPPSGQCPECGTAYSFEAVRRLWRLYYGYPPASPPSDLINTIAKHTGQSRLDREGTSSTRRNP